MITAADHGYELRLLLDRVAAVEARCKRLEETPRVTVERAQVTITGGAMCTVTYATGTTRTVPFSSTYTPVFGDQVWVINSPAWSGVVSKVSA